MTTAARSPAGNATHTQATQPSRVVGLEDIEISDSINTILAEMGAKRGTTAQMSEDQRAGYITAICRALRLNPLTCPVQFIVLNGKETLYVTKTATDQLAAMHNLDRETIAGPEVRLMEGVKVVFCQVKGTLPNGRKEVSTATLPLDKIINDLMKCETKAKRRVTLSILGLGMLTEQELETIPDSEKSQPSRPAVALAALRVALAAAATLSDVVAAYRPRSQALHDEGSSSVAAGEVEEWVAEYGLSLSKQEVNSLLSGHFDGQPIDLLAALATQSRGASIVEWFTDKDIAQSIEGLPAGPLGAVKRITARTWCQRTETQTERPNEAFKAALDAARPQPEAAPVAPEPPAEEPVTDDPERDAIAGGTPAEADPFLEGIHARIAEIELPGEAVAVWLKHRPELSTKPAPDREAVWVALCKRAEEVGKMKNAKVWLKKAIAEEDARRTEAAA